MLREVILDIGVGKGGKYINPDRSSSLRIGMDIDLWELALLRQSWRNVVPLMANAEHIPLSDNSVSRIEMILPHKYLVLPGLQNQHPGLLKEYTTQYLFSYPHAWYPEYSRVLKPNGELLIIGDVFVDLPSVMNCSNGIFEITLQKKLSLQELARYKTETTETLLRRYREEFTESDRKRFEEGLVQIDMKNNKRH